MNNKTYLIKSTINKTLDLIKNLGESNEQIPNDIKLTKLLGVSRTTIRVAMKHLCDEAIIKRDGRYKMVMRQPTANDYFHIQKVDSTKDAKIETYFLNLIHSGKLLPGDKFTELELAKKSGCTTVTVREFLIKFSNYGLIEKIPRACWKMVKFDEEFARELVSFRQMVEMRSIVQLMKLPREHPSWLVLNDLLEQHQAVKSDLKNRYTEFHDLDRALHLNIQQASKNRFTGQFFDIVSFVCHYHYQWDKAGEFERIKNAINEHIDLLQNLISNNNAGSILSMEKHLDTAQRTLLRCVHGLELN